MVTLATGTSSELLGELAVVLLMAAAVTLFFRKLRIPVFLGYLLAGFMIGPGLLGIFDADTKSGVRELSEFGVIFLMFYIGMEFDLRKLRRVLGPSLVALILQTLAMLLLGVQVALVLGWSSLQGVFLGGLLSISSSMVTISVLTDLGRMQNPHAQMAVGILILEDILAVVLLVVLSGMAFAAINGGGFDFLQVFRVTFLIAVFVTGTFFVGKLLAPKFLQVLNRIGSIELITIWIVALILGVSLLAQEFDFSPALGAFLAGSILSQSLLARQIETATEPLRNIFCAIFFVSIGLLIEPSDVVANLGLIIFLSLAIVVLKTTTVWLGLFLAGQLPRTAFRAAVAKAQIGEFSFVIVGVGMQAGVIGGEWMAIAVGTSIVSAAIALSLTVFSDPIYADVSRRVPAVFLTWGRFYHNVWDEMQTRLSRSAVWLLIRRPLTQIAFNIFLISAIIILSSVAAHFVETRLLQLTYGPVYLVGIWLVCALACLPFATAILRNSNALSMIVAEAALTGTRSATARQRRMVRLLQSAASVGFLLSFGAVYITAMSPYLPSGAPLFVFLGMAAVISFLFWNRIIRLNSRLEVLFMESFNQQVPTAALERRRQMMETVTRQYPWPAEINSLELGERSLACGHSIRTVRLRELTGATVVGVSRGGQVLYDPPPDTVFFPGDTVYIFGAREQLDGAERLLLPESIEAPICSSDYTFEIEKIYLTPSSELVDQTLASANLRRSYGVTVLGIQRGAEQITTLTPDEILCPGDMLYVIGDKRAIQRLQDTGEALTNPPFRPLSARLAKN